MELFKNTNYDFLGKKWPFIIASLVLTVAGFASIAMKGGLKYGIDFKGGALMTVKFAAEPPLEKIRAAMKASQAIHGEVSVQSFTGATASNEVEIGTELADEKQLNVNRQAMEQVLAATFGQPNSGKLDLNNTSQEQLANRLREALQRSGVAMSDQQVQNLAVEILSYAAKNYSGLLTDFSQLSSVPGMNAGIINTLRQESFLAPYHVMQVQMVGPRVGAELWNKAVLATLYALAGMLVYIAFRFEWIYGLLTMTGFSTNDTIVIFDRIRENLKLSRREPLEQVMNKAVNQTLSRTVMTSGLTFLTVIALFIWGGPVLHSFSFALVCGIIVGTYSSVFVASPIVLFWHNYSDPRKRTAPALATAPRADSVRKSPTKAVK